jgi:hypothetical protein
MTEKPTLNRPTILIEPMTSEDIFRTDWEEFTCYAWVAYNLKKVHTVDRKIVAETQRKAQARGKAWLKYVINAESNDSTKNYGIIMTSDRVKIERFDYDFNDGLCGIKMTFTFKIFRDDTIYNY